jgi:hypothetical protein
MNIELTTDTFRPEAEATAKFWVDAMVNPRRNFLGDTDVSVMVNMLQAIVQTSQTATSSGGEPVQFTEEFATRIRSSFQNDLLRILRPDLALDAEFSNLR